MTDIDFSKLKEPFKSTDIEWRAGQCGAKGNREWVRVLAYVTNRAIMQRLDDVCGPQNWRNEFGSAPDGGVLCGISIRCDGEWVTKYDGAANTEIEAIKGGLSGAMKRAAVQWGIGRYLYSLEADFGRVVTKGTSGAHFAQTRDKKPIYWLPPELPDWALPKGESNRGSARTLDLGDEVSAEALAPDAKPESKTATKPANKSTGKGGSVDANGSVTMQTASGGTRTIVSTKEAEDRCDAIKAATCWDELVEHEKWLANKTLDFPTDGRRILVSHIVGKAQSLMPKSDKQAQSRMLNRLDGYASNGWITEDDRNSFKSILQSKWS